MRIRPASGGDAERLVALIGDLGYEVDPDGLLRRLSRISRATDAEAFVAVLGTRVVGLIAFQLIETIEQEGPLCRITALVTDAEYRRRGVASHLLNTVETEAQARLCRALEVTTQRSRGDALAFYGKNGFVEQPRRLLKPLG